LINICFIAGVYLLEKNEKRLSKVHQYIENLMTLCWNRANDEGSGIGWYDFDKNTLGREVKEGPLVWSKSFHENYPVMISHGIYSNSGTKKNIEEKLHPLYSENDKLLFAFNGNIPNHEKLRKLMPEYTFNIDGDTETLANLLEKAYEQSGDIFKSVKLMYSVIDGPCNFETILDDGSLVIGRSPDGNKPLHMAKNRKRNVFSFASESSALQQYFRDEDICPVKPGEVIKITKGIIESKIYPIKPIKRCPFEFPYFAKPDSYIDGINVGSARRNIGKILALKNDIPTDAKTGAVPDSAIELAQGFAGGMLEQWINNCETLKEAKEIANKGIPLYNVLMRNRFGGIKRTFMQSSEELRDHAIRIKFNPVKENITDEDIYIIDDSIVRGRTIKQIVRDIKRYNPKKVHMLIGFPEIKYPCHIGIDMQTKEELISANMTQQEIINYANLDSLEFATMEDISKATGFPIEEFCLGCTEGIQPITPTIDIDHIDPDNLFEQLY